MNKMMRGKECFDHLNAVLQYKTNDTKVDTKLMNMILARQLQFQLLVLGDKVDIIGSLGYSHKV